METRNIVTLFAPSRSVFTVDWKAVQSFLTPTKLIYDFRLSKPPSNQEWVAEFVEALGRIRVAEVECILPAHYEQAFVGVHHPTITWVFVHPPPWSSDVFCRICAELSPRDRLALIFALCVPRGMEWCADTLMQHGGWGEYASWVLRWQSIPLAPYSWGDKVEVHQMKSDFYGYLYPYLHLSRNPDQIPRVYLERRAAQRQLGFTHIQWEGRMEPASANEFPSMGLEAGRKNGEVRLLSWGCHSAKVDLPERFPHVEHLELFFPASYDSRWFWGPWVKSVRSLRIYWMCSRNLPSKMPNLTNVYAEDSVPWFEVVFEVQADTLETVEWVLSKHPLRWYVFPKPMTRLRSLILRCAQFDIVPEVWTRTRFPVLEELVLEVQSSTGLALPPIEFIHSLKVFRVIVRDLDNN